MNLQTKKNFNTMLSENDVVAFLKENPNFLIENTDALEAINLRHDSGGAISLIEYQVKLLRKQKKEVEERLTRLMQTATNNEKTISRMQRFTLEMINSDNLDDVIASCQSLLCSDFSADFATIRLFGDIDNPHFTQVANMDSRILAPLFRGRKPVCGRITNKQREFMFGKNAKDIKSTVLIPLQRTKNMGVLALGSLDETHFTPAMGTLFLDYLGELVTSTITQFINEDKL